MSAILSKTKKGHSKITITKPAAKGSAHESITKEVILEDYLGKGAFGEVFEAYKIKNGQKDDKKPLAIKIHKMHGRTQASVLKEEQELAKIQSKAYKTKVYPLGKDGVISVMPKLPGKPLDLLREELKRLTLSQRLELAALIAQTYAEFHAKRAGRDGLSHTDIKPDNILVDIQWVNGKPQFKVRIIDFSDIRNRNLMTSAPERLQGQKINADIEHALEQETYGMVFLLAPVLGGPANTEIKPTLKETKKFLKKEGKKLGLTAEMKKITSLLEAMSSDNPALRPSDLAVGKILNTARIACIEKEENTIFAAFKSGRTWAFIQDNIKKLTNRFNPFRKEVPAMLEAHQVNAENLTAFGMAIKLGQYDEAKRLLQQCVTAQEKQTEIAQRDLNRRSLLHLAVLAKRIDLVQLLLENGADANQLDGDGRSPLHCAIAMRADAPLIHLLLENGADLTKQNSYGYIPLQSAIVNACSVEVVKLIFEKHKPFSASQIMNLFYFALESRNISAARFLLANGADKGRDNADRTALHLAVMTDHQRMIDIVIEKGADINAVDHQQRTPLHLAVLTGRTDVAKSLVLTGAKVNMKDSEGHTPLHLVILQGNKELVRFLRRHYDKAEFQAIMDETMPQNSAETESVSGESVSMSSCVVESKVENKSQKSDENTTKISSISPMLSWFGSPAIGSSIPEEEKVLVISNEKAEPKAAEALPAVAETDVALITEVEDINSVEENRHKVSARALVSSRLTCLAPGTGVYLQVIEEAVLGNKELLSQVELLSTPTAPQAA